VKTPSSTVTEEHPKGSGKYRVRARLAIDPVTKKPKFKTLISGVSKPKADEVADAYVVVANANELRHGVTVKAFGVGFLARRAAKGIRAVKKDEYYWNKHIAGDPIGDVPVSSLIRRDIVEWLDRRTSSSRGKNKPPVPMHHETRKKLRNLLRTALGEAVERGLLDTNPALEVKVHKAGAASSVDDLEGILTPDEQQALIAAVPERWRPMVVFALCTGLRQAEQWWLNWDDPLGPTVLEDRIIVRRSTGGLPPKSGKVREVFLLPAAKAALQAQVGRRGIVFKAPMGGRWQEGKSPRYWASWVAAAGITRHVTWHDLRHTCATALLAGWWGRKWSLDEVCSFLGHSSITVTERYARKLNESQKLAVSATPTFAIPAGIDDDPEPSATPRKLNGSTKKPRAFVKHRSRVQVSESAPIANPAEKLLVSRSTSDTENGALGDHFGIKSDLEEAREFEAAVAEDRERAEAFAELARPLAKSPSEPPKRTRTKGGSHA
jgi:integrase